MGPTWSQLVNRGIEKYPLATHGILADADFMPINTLDKRQLDPMCGKHMFTVWSGSQERTSRNMDWIYRNIPGVKVERRTHQILNVPEFPGRKEQTIIDLQIEEQPGGFQDRSGQKSERYLSWLMKDLAEWPDDPRTLYYLGHGHWEIFLANNQNPSQSDLDHLHESVKWFEKRVSVQGNFEERWFAMLKLGEMHDRFLNAWPTALKWYERARDEDPERADTYFYIGQHYRLQQQYKEAVPWLIQAADKPIPQRSLFQWHDMYLCLSKLELGRAASQATLSLSQYRTVAELLARAECEGAAQKQEIRGLHSNVLERITKIEENVGDLSKADQVKRIVKKLQTFMSPLMPTLERKLNKKMFKQLSRRLAGLNQLQDVEPTCKDYRLASKTYLTWFADNEKLLKPLVGKDDYEAWLQQNTAIRALCR
eukprot:TRINITY_DN832_c0_g1_i2.p1 TRINITY_DN832_c0_g1~~TRINITY_DN832_c0_g1_i2.p1  ORF type:complete len:425 (+),score=84.18 TRINITY_DN832_c0_g1_i2:352-1626(+)